MSTIIPVDRAELTRVKYFIQKFKLQNIISPHFLSKTKQISKVQSHKTTFLIMDNQINKNNKTFHKSRLYVIQLKQFSSSNEVKTNNFLFKDLH